MAVIQISKVQVRRGLQEDLPQLSSGEMGWSVDQRRLFIGNGSLSEGAPNIGNTEILTQYSDILNVLNSYYFKGSESGYTSQTGSTVFTPVLRTLQNKLDEDKVSVRNFGAIGDGITDDTVAIQRAISQLYPNSQYSNQAVRRVLYFPAGIYNVNSEFSIPAYCTIIGDGIESSIIKQNNSAARSLLTFQDSQGQVSPVIGANSAILPLDIMISDITLQNISDNDVVYVDGVRDVTFNNVKIVGMQTNPTTNGTSKSLIRILGTSNPSYNIKFNQCKFETASYAIITNSDVYGVTIDKCSFYRLYQGVYSTGTTIYPKSIRILNSNFDRLASSAITSIGYSNIISAYNYFKNVGNNFGATPTAPIIYNQCPENYSISDLFDRTLTQSDIYPLVSSTGSFSSNVSVSHISYGSLRTFPGATDIISANSTLANTSITLSSVTDNNAIIDYTLTSGTNTKTGTLRISINTLSSNQFYYEDDFVEYPAGMQFSYGINSPTGTQLLFVNYGNVIVLAANTSVSSGNVTFKYNIRKFK